MSDVYVDNPVGYFTGKGRKTYDNGNYYEGDWKNGEPNGKGKLVFSDGIIHEGDFVDGRLEKGKVIWTNGVIYEGIRSNLETLGKGKMIFPNGNVYEGDFWRFEMSGKGKMTFPNGYIYEGNWERNNRSGSGKLIYPNGDTYVGKFANDCVEGKGKMTYANGDVYLGEWRNFKRSGKGKMVYANGTVEKGLWENDEFTGEEKQEDLVLALGAVNIFFIIGWTLYLLNNAHFPIYLVSLTKNEIVQSLIAGFFLLGPTGIAVLPMWLNIMRNGFMGLLLVPSYSVITETEYADGTVSRSSDYGEEAMISGIFWRVVWFGLGYFLAVVATLGVFVVQFFTFIFKFKYVKNKISYSIVWAALIAYLFIAPGYIEKLAPVFDPNSFNPTLIASVVESSQKRLYAGNYSYTVQKILPWKKKRGQKVKYSYIANLAYTKATDTTVIEITAYDEKIYLERFDKGKNKVPYGKYTFKGSELVNSDIQNNRTISDEGITELVNLFPANLIFKRLSDGKERWTVNDITDSELHPEDLWISYSNAAGRKDKIAAYFYKNGDNYRLSRFVMPPYEAAQVGIAVEISY